MSATCTTPSCDAVGLLVTFAQLGQFLPQHWEMMSEKTAVGLSPYLLFFNSLYTLLAAIDITILETHQSFSCSASPYRCFMQAQPLIQMIGSAALCIGMWYWFLKYHHQSPAEADPEEQRLFNSFFYSPDAQTFYQGFIATSAMFCLLPVVLAVKYGFRSPALTSYAHFCGVLSAFLNGIMWIPQIIVTSSYGHKGALSIAWVFASVVMDVTFSLYLAGMGSHWTVWANNVPDGIQTSVLLVLLLRLEYLNGRERQDYQTLGEVEEGVAHELKLVDDLDNKGNIGIPRPREGKDGALYG